ncbi:MAG: SDR family oxidoreductase, partial [Chthoniobacterales bacterium]
LLIAGCGFLGESAAGFFLSSGWEVVPLTASQESVARLAEKFPAATAADISSAESLDAVRAQHGAFDLVLHCASSGRGGADAYRNIYVNGASRLSEKFPEARLIFTSSTSVYAQADGAWVHETSPAEPQRETGELLLEAESIALRAGGNVLRLAGIYGPGRSVLLRKFRGGSAVLEDGGHRWINQIHRDDAARAVLAVAQSGAPGEIYNVADDTPATQREVYGWIADFLNQPPPPEGPADMNRKRGWTSKRVSNARLRALGWAPQFSAYCVALPSLVGVES